MKKIEPGCSSRHLHRREFLQCAAGSLIASAVFPAIVPASALGRNGSVAPGNRIAVGVIGCGPQGLGVMGNFLNEKECRVVAVCDVKTDQLEVARNTVNARYANQDCQTYRDFHELIERKDIDACLIATPDHWHVLAALAAVKAGKDVYLEKPLAPRLEEGQALRAALRRNQRMFQFGTQQRSQRIFRFACELVRNGAIGKPQHINVWAPGSTPGGSTQVVPVPQGWDYERWLGPAPFIPYTENRCVADGSKKTWWFISDYSLGFVSGWGIHPLDIASWGAGDLFDGEVTVQGRGNFRLADGVCDTATIWEVDYRFASGLTMKFVGAPNGGNRSESTGEPFLHRDEWKQRYRRITTHGTAFEGSDGWVHVDRDEINLQCEDLMDINEDEFKTQLQRSSGHVRNFLESVRSRGGTVSNIDAALRADTLCHLADIAMRLGRKVTFDFRRERFIDDVSANAKLKARPMRKPWHLQLS